MKAAKTAQEFIAVWEAHDLAKSASLLADDFVLTAHVISNSGAPSTSRRG